MLRRIKALRDVSINVPKGTLGGYVESERNLAPGMTSWVFDSACVYGGACIRGEASVHDFTRVYGNAAVGAFATVRNRARIYGNAVVDGNAIVNGNAKVSGDAHVHGSSRICDFTEVFGGADIGDHVKIFDYAQVFGYATLRQYAVIFESASVYGYTTVCGDASISGFAQVGDDDFSVTISGDAEIGNRARICRNADFMTFKNTWSSFRHFTCFRTDDGTVKWKVGCFYGSGDELVAKAYKDSKLSGDCYAKAVRMANEVFARVTLDKAEQVRNGGQK